MVYKLNKLVGLLLVTSATIYSGLSASAASISLVNPGFELPDLSSTPEIVPGAGPFDFAVPPGWTLYNPDNLVPPAYDGGANAPLATAFVGAWRPSAAFFSTLLYKFPE